jgi:hypothetical protein
MSGNKVFQILLAVAMFCIMTTAVQAYEIADSFQNPLDNYVVTGYRFGNAVGSLYHAGEDLKAAHPDPVRAIANGVLRQSKEYSDGYGNVVVIEHTLPDGKKIISIYGHLSRKDGYKMIKLDPTGKEVPITKGQIIGYIGKHDSNPLLDENGIGGDHLHLGIKKGAYVANLYEGNVPLSGLSNFNKPSDYLNLIRANTPEVYRLANLGNKVWVSSSSTFNSCGWRWDDIRPVSVAERNSHPTSSGSPCFAAGTFIKRANNPDISLVKGYSDGAGTIQNRLHQRFTNWDAFIRAGGKADLSNVRIVSDVEYNLHAQGKDLTYNGNY